MTPEEVVRAVLEQRPQSGWGIFHLNKRKVTISLLVRFFYVILFVVCAGAMLSDWWIKGSIANVPMYNRFLSLFFGLAAVIALWSFFKYLFILFGGGKSMVVLTNDSLVVAMKNDTREYPYDKISDLALSYVSSGYNRSSFAIPQPLVKFTDLRDGSSVIIDEAGIFGQGQEIYNILHSKLT